MCAWIAFIDFGNHNEVITERRVLLQMSLQQRRWLNIAIEGPNECDACLDLGWVEDVVEETSTRACTRGPGDERWCDQWHQAQDISHGFF